MADWKRRYSTEHLDASDIPDRQTPTVTIVAIGSTELENGPKATAERKMMITFEPSPGFGKVCKKRTWVAAKVCGYCLAAMFGGEDAGWIGKRVTLQVEQVDAWGDLTDAVRVKGSPDIQAPVSIRVKMGRRGKVQINLVPTAMTRTSGND